MPTRREVLIAAFAAGVLRGSRTSFAKASQPATPVNFAVPANACDCHTHIFADPAKFPYWSGRPYTPETALPEEMSRLHRALHIERVVIVTPSVYGTDNSATLFGMKARGATARGVAVIDGKAAKSDLDTLEKSGFRGIRLNFFNLGEFDTNVARKRFSAAVEQLKPRPWHIQIYASMAIVAAIKDLVQAAPMPVVFDHFGGAVAALGLEQPGFVDLVELVRSGKAYVKVGAPYRPSTAAPGYSDVVPFAKVLIAANAERILWGSDWPHPHSVPASSGKATDVTPLTQVDDARLLNQFGGWAPDPAVRKKILVDNPAQLYGF